MARAVLVVVLVLAAGGVASAGIADKPLAGQPPISNGRSTATTVRVSALVQVEPGTEAAVRLNRRAVAADDTGCRVPYVDAQIFADELASYGPEVRVIEPVELADLVVARLRRARDLHAEAAG